MNNKMMGRPSLSGLTSRVAHLIKFLLLFIAISDLEGVSALLKRDTKEALGTFKDYLHFTNISLYYTIFCVVVGLLHSSGLIKTSVRNFFMVTALVLEAMVTVLFWCLFFLNPRLVCHKYSEGKSLIAKYMKECPKHLCPFVVMLIEQYGIPLEKKKVHRLFLLQFCIGYYLVAELYFKLKKDHLYPFLDSLGILARMCFFGMACLVSFLLYEACMFYKKRSKGKSRTKALKEIREEM